MPLPKLYNDAIINLGNIGQNVDVMTQQARILNTQRNQTFDILNRLRTLIRKLLTSYSNNKDTLQQVYKDIIIATTKAGDDQRNSLNQLANELKQSLNNPRTEQQFTELKEVVEALIREMDSVSSSDSGSGSGSAPALAAPAAADVQNQTQGTDLSAFLNRPGNGSLNDFDARQGSSLGGRRRRTKRGGYSWRTPSPNKSRKKTPTYKKTIKKTRTREK